MTKSNDAFRTISEVAKELGLATHVLRFWESKFPQIKPLKRAGGRRYYRPDDVALLRRLQHLLHDEGYTIKGVQKLLREDGARKLIDEANAEQDETSPGDSAVLDDISQNTDSDESTEQTGPIAHSSTKASIQWRAQVSPSSVTVTTTPTPDPSHQQASLFDSPDPTPVVSDTVVEEGETTPAPAQNDMAMPQPDSTLQSDSIFNPLPDPSPIAGDAPESDLATLDTPEPEPIYHPDAPPPQIIEKRRLSDTQRQVLEDVLAELKSMKEQIDSAA